jgi:hypothetical protein
MTNLGFIMAAYVITLGALGVYGVHLWIRLHHLERDVTALTIGERQPDGRR